MYEVIDDQGQCQVFSPLLTQVPSFEKKRGNKQKRKSSSIFNMWP